MIKVNFELNLCIIGSSSPRDSQAIPAIGPLVGMFEDSKRNLGRYCIERLRVDGSVVAGGNLALKPHLSARQKNKTIDGGSLRRLRSIKCDWCNEILIGRHVATEPHEATEVI